MKRILLVDDFPSHRNMFRLMLAREDVSIMEARNGCEALEILDKEEFDLLVTDIEMPILNGFDLMKAVKEKDKHKDMPVVVISAHTQYQNEALGLGVKKYILKPFDRKTIYRDIQEAL